MRHEDKYLSRLIDDVYDEFKEEGVSREQIKEIHESFWLNVSKFMADDRMPTIKVDKFLRFIPSQKRILARFKGIKARGNDKEKERLDTLYETYLRVKEEYNKRKRSR